MFGLVAARPVALKVLLRDAPRSLSTLSREHKDGWGIATHAPDGWTLHKSTACAAACPRYDEVASGTEATMLIAHVRQKTVGETALSNTHPFQRGPFVFAHNGTVKDVARVLALASRERAAEVTGDTDSERLFAFVATRIDEAGDVERGVIAAVRELHAMREVGSVNFLFSCGGRLYAHRLGRSLHVLERHATREQRRTPAVVVASERLTDEAWTELPERTLVVIEPSGPGGEPRTRQLAVA